MNPPLSGQAFFGDFNKRIDALIMAIFWRWADLQAPWLRIAYDELGTKEGKGSTDNPQIVAYLKSCKTTAAKHPKVDLESDATPWCSAYVNWVMTQAGYIGTGSTWARGWANWKLGRKIKTPVPGCITVFKRGEDLGHVAFCWNPDKKLYLGGNQGAGTIKDKVSDRVSITRIKAPVICHVWPLRPINPLRPRMGRTMVA